MKSRWPVRKLSEVAEIQMGQSPKGTSYNASGEGVPLINGPVEFGETPFSRTKKTKFTTEPTKLCKEGDLILCVRGSTTGRMNIAGYDSCIGRGVAAIRSKEHQDWINFFIHANRENIYKLGSGSTFPNVSGAILSKIEIPIPPIAQQKQIVAILDEAFEGIDSAIANTEKNLANARELFESYLQSVFTHKDEKWEETTLGKICQFENGDRGKNYPNRSEYVESGIPWINTGHIQPDGTLSESDMHFIAREKYDSLRSGKIRPGDLVYCLRGATIGKTAIVDPLTEGAVASSLVIIRPGNLVDSYFLYYFLTSSVGKKLIKLYDNGAAQPNLGAKSVAKYTLALPTLAEQKVIVEKLAAIAEEAQRLEVIYKQKLAALNELKQSILQKAFSGELTAEVGDAAVEKVGAMEAA